MHLPTPHRFRILSVLLMVSLIAVTQCVRTTPPPLLRECYECSHDDVACLDGYLQLDGMKTCTGRMCYKAKVDDNGVEKVVRGCWQVPIEAECKTERVAGVDSYTCHCFGDRCNTATAPAYALVNVLMPLVVCSVLSVLMM